MFDKIVFLVSGLSQPRAIRRVESIAALGIEVEVYGYDRGFYNCNKLAETYKVHVLGRLPNGRGYLGKLRRIGMDVTNIIERHRAEHCLYYSFGFIESFFVNRAGVPYAYEVSDIAYGNGILRRISPMLRQIDRRLVRQSVFTLMTSEGFMKYLGVDSSNVIIQPNKVNRKLLGCRRTALHKQENRFVFSFVGAFRYDTTIRFAKVIGERFPQHEFHIYGEVTVDRLKEELDEISMRCPNVKLLGSFKNPDDFEDIYGKVDIVVVTYGLSLNETILDPNKLYEGILFCRPLVATAGTYLAGQIKRYKCGFSIDSSTEESIAAFVSSLTAEKINEISAMEREMPDDFAFDDVGNLRKLLSSLITFR